MKRVVLILFATVLGAAAAIPDQGCDLAVYKAQDGLKARCAQGLLSSRARASAANNSAPLSPSLDSPYSCGPQKQRQTS
jgi:hypothetical protein